MSKQFHRVNSKFFALRLKNRQRVAKIVFSSLFLGLVACQPQGSVVQLQGKTMGTSYSIKYIPEKSLSLSAKQIQQQVDNLLEQVNQQMSTYRPDSQLSRFNQSRLVNQPFAVDPAVVMVIRAAKRINQLTAGAFDVTVGPLVNLWGFGPEGHDDRVPAASAIAERLAWVGDDKLQVVDDQHILKTQPQLYVDLSGIAKGYGVDLVAHYLASQHLRNYLVEIGGEVRAAGLNVQHKPWQIAIEKPEDSIELESQRIIPLYNQAVSTSGDYRNYFDQNGQHYSHTIDPHTGWPINNQLASVTVIADNCMTADGLSTALTVLGESKALALAQQHHWPVLLIRHDGKNWQIDASPAFQQIEQFQMGQPLHRSSAAVP